MKRYWLIAGLAFTFGCLGFLSSSSAQQELAKQFKWREIGPTATGGRVTDIAVDPNDEHHIFVASAAGGLWETENNGTTWKCIFENEGTLSIGDIALDPADAKTIWVGTGEANNQRSSLWGDGIYKSTDGGKTWKNMGLEKSQHIGRVIIHPTDSNTLYVAALGNLYSANKERGLYKTTDGGETWKKVLYVNPDVGVVDVAIDPVNPDNLLAASYERRRRAWNFDGNGPGSAIHRSTDGGKTWTRVEGGLPKGDIGRIGIEYFAKDPKIVYATVANQNLAPPRSQRPARRRANETAPGFQQDADPQDTEKDASKEKTADQDTEGKDPETKEPETIAESSDDKIVESKLGFSVDYSTAQPTLTKVSTAAKRFGLADGAELVAVAGINASDRIALTAFLANAKPADRVRIVFKQKGVSRTSTLRSAPTRTQGPRQIGGEVYRSEDGGETWKKVNDRPTGGSPAYYYGQIRVDPEDDQRLYILSVPVYVSTDGGKTFRSDGARSVHVDHHAFWINPNNPKHVMLGNDGGFHISYDYGKNWDYVFNLPMAQFYAIGVDMQKPYHVYGGLQDNGSWGGPSQAGGGGVARTDWYRVSGGDGFYVQVDPNDHNIVISESQFGAIGRSDRSTGARRSIRPPRSNPDTPDRYNWNSPILMSRFDPRTVYFAGNRLFKSTNRGDNWDVISPDLTTNDPAKVTGNVPHCTITTIAESPRDRNVLMVGTDDGKVQMTVDAGRNWTDLSGNFPFKPANWWCSRVEFSHADKNTAFVSFTGYREDDFRPFVYKTTDGGQSWTSIASNLPQGCVNVIKQDPVNANTLYVGTEFSVFVSQNGGDSWDELNQGLPRVSVQDLLVHPRDGDLLIGTHGRGIFVLDEISPFQYLDRDSKAVAQLLPIRDYTRLPRSFGGGGFGSGDRKRTAADPPQGSAIWYHLKDDVSAGDISLIIYDGDDKEVAKLTVKNKAGSHKVMFPQARSGRGGRGGRGGFRRGGTPIGGPGIYWAVLKVGDKKVERKFEIKNP